MEVHGDLWGEGVWRRRLQGDRQRPSHRVVMLEDVQLGGEDAHHGHWSVAWQRRGRSLTFRSICYGSREEELKEAKTPVLPGCQRS